MTNTLPELIMKYPIGTKVKKSKTRKTDYDEEITVDGYLYYGDDWIIVHKKGGAWYGIDAEQYTKKRG